MFSYLHRKNPVAALALLFAVLLAATACLCGCGMGTGGQSGGTSWAPPYYDTTAFHEENGRVTYAPDGAVISKAGIDVSEHQGYIDWNAVAADGIDFAVVRVGYRGTSEGAISADAYAEYNLQAAREAGLACGVYFFSQAVTVEEAREEAAFVLGFLGGAALDYPVTFDYEVQPEGVQSRTEGVSAEDAALIAEAFCQAIEEGGYDAMIYGNAYDLDRVYVDELRRYPLWYAKYGMRPTCRVPVLLWQYASDGRVAGIDAAVDMNLDLGSADAADQG